MKNNILDLVTIGDSTCDTFIKIHDASLECDIRSEECKICVKYGDKIPVDAIAHAVAGNAANVAVGCATLGMKTAIYTNLGDDDQGHHIKKTFEKRGVDTRYVQIHKNFESNLSVVLSYMRERTIFVYHQPWPYVLPNLDMCSWVYLTSTAQTFTKSNIFNEVCHFIDKTGAKLVFSPGTFQLKADIKKYPRLLEKCYLLIVNLEEAKKILELDTFERYEMRDLLSRLHLLGPKIVIVTDTENGSYAADLKESLKLGSIPTKVFEKTGAGDAFSSGLISALFYEKTLAEAMVWGSINASETIKQIGPNRGLVAKEKIEKLVKKYKNFAAIRF